jgi:hypothetical protein
VEDVVLAGLDPKERATLRDLLAKSIDALRTPDPAGIA